MFLSLVRPDRISSPMTRIAAVTMPASLLVLALGSAIGISVLPPPLPRQRRWLKARRRNGHNAHFMSNNGPLAWAMPSRCRNHLARRLLECTVGWAKGAGFNLAGLNLPWAYVREAGAGRVMFDEMQDSGGA